MGPTTLPTDRTHPALNHFSKFFTCEPIPPPTPTPTPSFPSHHPHLHSRWRTMMPRYVRTIFTEGERGRARIYPAHTPHHPDQNVGASNSSRPPQPQPQRLMLIKYLHSMSTRSIQQMQVRPPLFQCSALP